MDKILIYISYDQYEYANYFHLVVNDEIIMDYCPVERIDDLLEMIIEKESFVESFELDIVQDENASEWNYHEAFQEHYIELRTIKNTDSEQLHDVMKNLFDGEYGIIGEDDVSDKKLISVLWSGKCILKSDNSGNTQNPGQSENPINDHAREKTGLTIIIEEKNKDKNERLKKNMRMEVLELIIVPCF